MLVFRTAHRCMLAIYSLPPLLVVHALFDTTGWREPLITLPHDERLSLAESTLSVAARQTDYGDASSLRNGQSAVLLYTMAEYDLRANSTVFQTNVTAALDTLAGDNNGGFASLQRGLRSNSDRLRLGLAYFSAYLAYAEDDFLNASRALWEASATLFVSQNAAEAGTILGVVSGFNSTCSSPNEDTLMSVAGAVYWTPDSGLSNGETIGPWIILSSLLYGIDRNNTFLAFASQSVQFAKTFLSNGTMFFDAYDINNCTLNSATQTYNGGYFLQGLKAYYTANMTSVAAEDLNYLNELAASLILFPGWTEPTTGINREDAITSPTANVSVTNFIADWKAILVEGLYQCLSAGLLNGTVANLTQQYISVQYNAVRELASFTTPGIDQLVYGPSWVGTPIPLQDYNPPGQYAASALFVTALGVGPGHDVDGTPNDSSSKVMATRRKREAAIIGGVVGGLVILVASIIGVVWWRRRKHAKATLLSEEYPRRSSTLVDPYFATTSQYPVCKHGGKSLHSGDGLVHPEKCPSTPTGRYSTSSSGPSLSARDSARFEPHEGAALTVRVNASLLRQLLLDVGGGASNLQRDGAGTGLNPEAGPPPGYEERVM
ncbi:unnamed protein product [Peniophora sp. CBMAI 1063]|nr:unnamed protein product [Peniophora sp. CBMAI 1063]